MRHPSGVALIISSLLTVYQDDGLLLLVTVLPQALFALVRCHLVFLSFLTAWHNQSCFGHLGFFADDELVKKLF